MRLSTWPQQFCSQALPLSQRRSPLLDSVEAHPRGASLTIGTARSGSAESSQWYKLSICFLYFWAMKFLFIFAVGPIEKGETSSVVERK